MPDWKPGDLAQYDRRDGKHSCVVQIVRYPEHYGLTAVVREAQCDDEGPGPTWIADMTELEELPHA